MLPKRKRFRIEVTLRDFVIGVLLPPNSQANEVIAKRRNSGLVTHYVLFFLDLASRTVKIAGLTTHPNDLWMTQIARNLTDPEEEFLRSIRFLIMDRDTKYCA
jgi:hypothetical protein